jgi:hypothetical protein
LVAAAPPVMRRAYSFSAGSASLGERQQPSELDHRLGDRLERLVRQRGHELRRDVLVDAEQHRRDLLHAAQLHRHGAWPSSFRSSISGSSLP